MTGYAGTMSRRSLIAWTVFTTFMATGVGLVAGSLTGSSASLGTRIAIYLPMALVISGCVAIYYWRKQSRGEEIDWRWRRNRRTGA